MLVMRRRNLQKRDGQCGVYELPRWDVLGNSRGEQRDRLYELPRWDILGNGRGEQRDRLYELPGRVVLVDSWGERVYYLFSRCLFAGRGERVCELPKRHVFRGVGVVVRAVPGERAVGGGERGPGVLLLQERVCACGGLVHVQDL